MGVDVRCPACHAHTRVPDDALGRNIRCRKCNKPFTAQTGDAAPVKPAADRPRGSRKLLYVLCGAFVLLVVLVLILRVSGVL